MNNPGLVGSQCSRKNGPSTQPALCAVFGPGVSVGPDSAQNIHDQAAILGETIPGVPGSEKMFAKRFEPGGDLVAVADGECGILRRWRFSCAERCRTGLTEKEHGVVADLREGEGLFLDAGLLDNTIPDRLC